MPHLRLLRAMLGGAGLAGCIVLLAGQARAEAFPFVSQRTTVAPPLIVTGNNAPVSPDLFGTVALPVRVDRYAAGWRRAALDASWLPSMQRLVAPARGLSRDQQIGYIQTAEWTGRWPEIATALCVWIALPLVAGAARTIRRDVS